MFLPFFHVIDSGDSIIIEFECDCPANRDDEPFFDYVDFVVYFSFRNYELRLRLPIPLLFDGTEEVTSLQSQSSVITSLRLFKVNPDNSLPHETLEELKIFSRDYNYNTQPVLGTARNIVSPCEADARDALIGMDFMCVPTIDTTGTMNDG